MTDPVAAMVATADDCDSYARAYRKSVRAGELSPLRWAELYATLAHVLRTLEALSRRVAQIEQREALAWDTTIERIRAAKTERAQSAALIVGDDLSAHPGSGRLIKATPIAQGDRTRPAPGYGVAHHRQDEPGARAWYAYQRTPWRAGDWNAWLATEADAISATWAHHDAAHAKPIRTEPVLLRGTPGDLWPAKPAAVHDAERAQARRWRQLPSLYMGKPQYSIRNDDAEIGDGIVYWDDQWHAYGARSGGDDDINAAFAAEERVLGIPNAIRPDAPPAEAAPQPEPAGEVERAARQAAARAMYGDDWNTPSRISGLTAYGEPSVRKGDTEWLALWVETGDDLGRGGAHTRELEQRVHGSRRTPAKPATFAQGDVPCASRYCGRLCTKPRGHEGAHQDQRDTNAATVLWDDVDARQPYAQPGYATVAHGEGVDREALGECPWCARRPSDHPTAAMLNCAGGDRDHHYVAVYGSTPAVRARRWNAQASAKPGRWSAAQVAELIRAVEGRHMRRQALRDMARALTAAAKQGGKGR